MDILKFIKQYINCFRKPGYPPGLKPFALKKEDIFKAMNQNKIIMIELSGNARFLYYNADAINFLQISKLCKSLKCEHFFDYSLLSMHNIRKGKLFVLEQEGAK